MKPAYFIVSVDAEQPSPNYVCGTLLNLQTHTMKDALAAIRWQVEGGFKASDYRVCTTAHAELPGILETTDGKPVLIRRGVFTEAAFKRFILNTWGG